MQNKKSLLQRMLVIYITFFVILAVGLMHSFLPSFMKGYHQGMTMGANIASSWDPQTPRQIFMLGEVPLNQTIEYKIAGTDSLSDMQIHAQVARLGLQVNQPAKAGASPIELALHSIGGSLLLYTLTMLSALAWLTIIILMLIIIRSIRRSIKEESMLNSRCIWYIRTIGFLTIFAELAQDFVNWSMKSRAAELLSGSGIAVDTTFSVSYSTIIMSILIIFTAEVFAIGQNLSEEQKFTI